MRVWLNKSNLCVRVQYYYDGQIPKWAKANHVFLIGYLAGKMGPLPTQDFQGSQPWLCKKQCSFWPLGQSCLVKMAEYGPCSFLHFSDLPSPQSCWATPLVLR